MIQDFFSKLGKQERILVFIAGFFVLFAILDRVVLGPILSQIKVLDAEIEAKSQMVRRNKRILSFRDRITNEYNQYKSYLSAENASNQELIAEYFRVIESMANKKSIMIFDIQAGEESESPFARSIPIMLDCGGSLADVLDFIKMIEESNYLFLVTGYKFAPRSKGSDILRCTIQVQATIISEDVI